MYIERILLWRGNSSWPLPFRNYLLSSSEDGTIRLWSLQTFTCLVGYKGHNYPVWDVSFSPHGYYFVSGGHDRVARWETEHVSGRCSSRDKSWPFSTLFFLCQPVGNRPLPASADIFRSSSWRHLHPLPPQLQLRCHGLIWSHHSAVGCSNWQLRPHFHRAQGQD